MLLHIANDDAVGNKLKESGLPGDVLVWRELYTEGPIPGFAEAPEPAFRDGVISLTAAGQDALDGLADHAALNGVDQWLGGARLTGTSPQWRWDEEAGELVRMPASHSKNL